MNFCEKYCLLFLLLALTAALLIGCAYDNMAAPDSGDTNAEQQAPTQESMTQEPPPTETTTGPTQAPEELVVTVEAHGTGFSDDALIATVMPIIEANEEFYTIESARIYGVTKDMRDETGRSFYYFLEICAKTKFSSAEEMPHVQGLLAGCSFESLEDCRKAAISTDDPKRSSVAKKVLDFVKMVQIDVGLTELNYSLGVQTDENGAIAEVYGIEEDDCTFSIENYLPESAEAMYQRGVEQAQSYME